MATSRPDGGGPDRYTQIVEELYALLEALLPERRARLTESHREGLLRRYDTLIAELDALHEEDDW